MHWIEKPPSSPPTSSRLFDLLHPGLFIASYLVAPTINRLESKGSTAEEETSFFLCPYANRHVYWREINGFLFHQTDLPCVSCGGWYCLAVAVGGVYISRATLRLRWWRTSAGDQTSQLLDMVQEQQRQTTILEKRNGQELMLLLCSSDSVGWTLWWLQRTSSIVRLDFCSSSSQVVCPSVCLPVLWVAELEVTRRPKVVTDSIVLLVVLLRFHGHSIILF